MWGGDLAQTTTFGQSLGGISCAQGDLFLDVFGYLFQLQLDLNFDQLGLHPGLIFGSGSRFLSASDNLCVTAKGS